MPMGMTSYFSRFRACSTEAAESREISCSPLRPPNRTPTLSFFITDNVPQGAVRRLTRNQKTRPLHHGGTELRRKTEDKWVHLGPGGSFAVLSRAECRYFDLVSPAERRGHGKTKARGLDHRFSVPLVRRSRGRRAHFRGCLDEFIQLAGRLPLQQVIEASSED